MVEADTRVGFKRLLDRHVDMQEMEHIDHVQAEGISLSLHHVWLRQHLRVFDMGEEDTSPSECF